MPKPIVGFCGLGAMGMGMATHLVKQGFRVKGFDMASAALSAFKSAGGRPATALSDSAQDAMLYILMVANQEQAQQALFDADDTIVEALPEGAVLCVCSTVAANYIKQIKEELQKVGRGDIRLVDCPVSGGAKRAANGELTIMVGADAEAVALAKPLLEELTAPGGLFIVEGGLGQGSNMKMCHQVLASVQILATCEAHGMAASFGLDAQELRERILDSEAWSWMYEDRSSRILNEGYSPPVSAVTIIKKDSAIVTKQARSRLWPTPICSSAEQVFTWCVAFGFGPRDDASVVTMYWHKPVADIKCTLSPEERERRIHMIIEMMVAIHIASACESIMLADACDIPLKQFFALVMRSAGASRMFEKFAKTLSEDEGAEPVTGRTMEDVVRSLTKVIDLALTVGFPTPLSNGTLDLYSLFGRRVGVEKEASNLLRAWE